jgi:hypothetical protein
MPTTLVPMKVAEICGRSAYHSLHKTAICEDNGHMARIGCGIAVVGVLLMCGSFAFFGVSIARALDARQVASIPVAVGEEITTDLIDVDTSRQCQVTLQVDVRTESAQEKDDGPRFPDEKAEFEARYDFPFRFTVLDAEGNTVYSSSNRVAWNSGSQSTTAEDVDAKGGTVSVEHSYDKFKVSPPGKIRVRIEFESDETYHAETQKVMLNVYDNVSKHGTSVFGGFAMMFVGPVLIFSGVIVFFIGILTGSKRPNTEPPSQIEDWETID